MRSALVRLGAGVKEWSGMIALVVAVGTGTAWAATYVVSSNSQIGPDTVSGHKVTGGNHANIIAGSIAASDIAPSFSNEPWQVIAENARTATDPCYSRNDTFCGDSNNGVWTNYGGEWMGARFYRAAGVVHIEGLIKFVPLGNPQTALISKAIFILPRTYRPGKKLVFRRGLREGRRRWGHARPHRRYG
jgi:hypothetical protein